ncbi:MAG TPA: hypothetical protein VNO21_03550, partial [Polyangiaceae bacterium]|nr:hypothetical protein [Polyangiaceae bacterium]
MARRVSTSVRCAPRAACLLERADGIAAEPIAVDGLELQRHLEHVIAFNGLPLPPRAFESIHELLAPQLALAEGVARRIDNPLERLEREIDPSHLTVETRHGILVISNFGCPSRNTRLGGFLWAKQVLANELAAFGLEDREALFEVSSLRLGSSLTLAGLHGLLAVVARLVAGRLLRDAPLVRFLAMLVRPPAQRRCKATCGAL